MEFGLNEAIKLFNDQTKIVNDLWGIFQVVSVGLLSLTYGNAFLRKNGSAKIALGFAFFIFAGGNRAAIGRSQEILEALAASFDTFAKDHPDAFVKDVPGAFPGAIVKDNPAAFVKEPFHDVIPLINAPGVESLTASHWVFSIIVIVLLFVPDLVRGFKDRSEPDDSPNIRPG